MRKKKYVVRVCCFAETVMLDIKIQYAYEAVQGCRKCTAELKNKFCFLNSLLLLSSQVVAEGN